jgi:hypothetical protein
MIVKQIIYYTKSRVIFKTVTEERELKEKYIAHHIPQFIFYLANLHVFIVRALPMNITIYLDLLRYILVAFVFGHKLEPF